jgi:hypothetical protein
MAGGVPDSLSEIAESHSTSVPGGKETLSRHASSDYGPNSGLWHSAKKDRDCECGAGRGDVCKPPTHSGVIECGQILIAQADEVTE